MKIIRCLLLISVALICFAGCASRRPNIIARCGTDPMPASAATIGFIAQPHLQTADRILERDVAAELARRGFRIVPPAEAEFTLACVIEDDWLTTSYITQIYQATQRSWVSPAPFGTGVIVVEHEADPLLPIRHEESVRLRGIRVRLHRTETLRSGKFDAAWEGYVEAGLDLRPEQQPLLLRTLFDYFGRDFVGHVKIAR